MKTILLVMVMGLFLSCKGGESSSVPATLDQRLFEGSATWEANYNTWEDELEFVGDECYRTLTQYTSGGMGGPYLSTYKLTPITSTQLLASNVTSDSFIIWDYSFQDGDLVLCDQTGDCVTFEKQ